MAKEIYKGKYLTVYEDRFEGVTYEKVIVRDWVAVAAVKGNKVLVIKEKKGNGEAHWGVVSGWVDKDGKKELEIAQEELLEEVGLISNNWEKIYDYRTGGQTISERATFFIAHDVEESEEKILNPDNDQILESKWLSLNELHELLIDNKIPYSSSIQAATLALQHLDSNTQELAGQLVVRLRENNKKITIAESCTGGYLAHLLTNVEGSSSVFRESHVLYSNTSKIAIGVSQEILEEFGVYSEELVCNMAQVVAQQSQADVAVAVTGSLTRVDPENNNSLPGEFYYAIYTLKGVFSEKRFIEDSSKREDSKDYIAKIIFDKLDKIL